MKSTKWGEKFKKITSVVLVAQILFASMAFLIMPTMLRAGSTTRSWSTRGNFTSSTILNNIDISGIQDGDDASATLGRNIDAGANMILLWEGAVAPTGWSIDTSFDNRFIRGNSVYGGTGEETVGHVHNLTEYSIRPNDYYNYGGSGNQIAVAAKNHLHGTPEVTIDSATNETPPYQDFKVIKYNNGTPAVIPSGAIAFFDGALPNGWSSYASANGRLLRGGSVAGTTGGTSVHEHELNIAAIYDSGGIQMERIDDESYVASSNHSHPAVTRVITGSNLPSYASLVLARADADISTPEGMIAMFNGKISGAWSSLSESGDIFNERFLYSDSSYAQTGGGTHSHAGAVSTSGSVGYTGVYMSQYASAVSPGNSHAIDYATDSAEINPAYKDVVIGKLTGLYSAPGTISNLKIDAQAKASWGNVFWEGATPANAAINFRVRSADTEASLADATWSKYYSVSGDTLDALDSQWLEVEATLISLDHLSVPTLNEFSISYSLIDQSAPVITLNGSSTVSLMVGDNYIEEGATTDDGSTVYISGVVDNETVGSYVIRYNSTDGAGNASDEVIRTVNIVSAPVADNTNITTTATGTSGNTSAGVNTVIASRTAIAENAEQQVLGANQSIAEEQGAVRGTSDDAESSVNENKSGVSRGIQWYYLLVPLSLALGLFMLLFGWKRRKEED